MNPTTKQTGTDSMADTPTTEAGRDFIRDIVQADLDAGCVKNIVTRFLPPNAKPQRNPVSVHI